ncbi:cuticle protein-like [Musca vetustissima]|uniref:cuticle protein-like n=1 Tax=Musca vetustissima TaxID=27455 RepID=UPI002AB61A74|nr:cuticle protein-like [Musca vetustissima]
MFKFAAFFALLAVAAAAPGLITETHHVVQPVVTKTAYVDNSASSAITHQSFTNLERKVPVVHTVAAAPVVKTVATPVVHTYAAAAAPLVKTVAAPVVHTYAAAPVLKTVATPVVHTYAAAPVVHTAPLVKTVVSAPVTYTAFH